MARRDYVTDTRVREMRLTRLYMDLRDHLVNVLGARYLDISMTMMKGLRAEYKHGADQYRLFHVLIHNNTRALDFDSEQAPKYWDSPGENSIANALQALAQEFNPKYYEEWRERYDALALKDAP